jgi:hypothetical protein
MDNELQAFYRTLELNLLSENDLPAWVGEHVIHYINEENVGVFLGILGRASGHANLAFWARINSAPTTDEEWRKVMWIGSPISPDAEERQVKQYRRAAEVVRNFVGHEQSRRNALFRSSN